LHLKPSQTEHHGPRYGVKYAGRKVLKIFGVDGGTPRNLGCLYLGNQTPDRKTETRVIKLTYHTLPHAVLRAADPKALTAQNPCTVTTIIDLCLHQLTLRGYQDAEKSSVFLWRNYFSWMATGWQVHHISCTSPSAAVKLIKPLLNPLMVPPLSGFRIHDFGPGSLWIIFLLWDTILGQSDISSPPLEPNHFSHNHTAVFVSEGAHIFCSLLPWVVPLALFAVTLSSNTY
jgi:hypothetical protein